MEARRWGRLSR